MTLRDVAERAGVSVTTASFVLSGRHEMRISAATEERVLQAARTLDYRRRLVTGAALPTGAPAIGLISDVVATESFAGEMLRGCIAAANDRGHVVLIADSEGADELEESAARALLSRGVDRFIYATMGTIVYQVPELLRDQRLVLMNNIDPTLDGAGGHPGRPPGRAGGRGNAGRRRAHHRDLAGRPIRPGRLRRPQAAGRDPGRTARRRPAAGRAGALRLVAGRVPPGGDRACSAPDGGRRTGPPR